MGKDVETTELTAVVSITSSPAQPKTASANPLVAVASTTDSRHASSVVRCADNLDASERERLFGGPDLRSENGVITRFSFSTFAWELLTHFWFPLSLPALLAVDGVVGAQNKIFIPRCTKPPPVPGDDSEPNPGLYGCQNWRGVVNSWWWAFLQPAPIVIAVLFAPWALGIAVVTFGFNIYRVCTIAGKYASFPKAYYEHFLTTPAANVTKDLLLVSWYIEIPEAIMEEQIEFAETFSGVQLNQLPNITLVGGRVISARAYLKELLRATFGQKPSLLSRVLVDLVGASVSFMPIAAIIVHFSDQSVDTWKRDWGSMLCCGLMFFAAIFIGPACARFMHVAVVHHQRSYNAQQALLRAVVRSNRMAQTVDDMMISLSRGSNQIAWDGLRLLVRNFGRVYANRISFNTLSMVIVTVVALMKLVFDIVVLGNTPTTKVQAVLTACILFTFVFTCVMAFFGILYPVLVNQTEVEISALLAHEELALFFQISDEDRTAFAMSTADEEMSPRIAKGASFLRLEPTTDLDPTLQLYRLKALRAVVEQRSRVDPVEVMYIKATAKVLTAFVAYVGSATTFLIGLLMRSGTTV